MLRYKTKTRPVLVALYDIRPGNGAGQFLQPQSPHGAVNNIQKNYSAEGNIEITGKKTAKRQSRSYSIVNAEYSEW